MKRLDVNDPNVFDRWRELYDDLSQEENIQFGYDMEAKYPGQQSYDASFAEAAIVLHSSPRVLEIGGWKGELAAHCLSKFHIESWLNIDMCKAAIEKTVPMAKASPRYRASFPQRFDWFSLPRMGDFDVAISAHTIEHLSDRHLVQLIKWLTGIPVIMFEAPIPEEGRSDWTGYQGTHILAMNWREVRANMATAGYSATRLAETAWLFKLGGR